MIQMPFGDWSAKGRIHKNRFCHTAQSLFHNYSFILYLAPTVFDTLPAREVQEKELFYALRGNHAVIG